jgi:hypothetical protein
MLQGRKVRETKEDVYRKSEDLVVKMSRSAKW